MSSPASFLYVQNIKQRNVYNFLYSVIINVLTHTHTHTQNTSAIFVFGVDTNYFYKFFNITRDVGSFKQ